MAEIKGYCTLCRSRCGAIYTVDGAAMTGVRPDTSHPTGTAMCPKGRAAPELVHSPRRLTTPLRRTTPKTDPDPKWEAISWEAALEEVAQRLGRIRDESGPESVAFTVTSPSGTPLSDSIEWVERFIRLFGSPNTCYSTEICNWHKDVAHAFTFGSGMPTPDYQGADLAILWGHNPAKSWLAQSVALADGRARGTSVAVIDPRRSTSALQADHWLRVLPGTDAALALGIAGMVLDRAGHDDDHIREWSNGPLLVRCDNGKFLRAEELVPGLDGYVAYDELSGQAVPYDTRYAAATPERFALFGKRTIKTRSGLVECLPAFERYADACREWTVERTCATTGVDELSLRNFVDAFAGARSIAYHAWTGVGQHTNATQTERAIASLYALTGSFDAPGGNVILPKHPVNPLTSHDQLHPDQRAKALGLDRHPLGPPSQGWISSKELCEAIISGKPYPVRGLMGFGNNLLVTQADPLRTTQALKSLEFYVHLDLFMNPTAEFADIVLPVNTPWEHEAVKVGFEITQRAQERIQHRPRMMAPVGNSRSDTEVIVDLAQRLDMGDQFFNGDISAGLNYQLEPLGLTVDDLRANAGVIDRPLTTEFKKYELVDSDGSVRGFATPTRRIELYSERLLDHGYSPVPEHPVTPWDERFPLTLTCAKNGYYCHSQHRGISSLRKKSPDPMVDVSLELAAEKGIIEGQWLIISTRNARIRMRARIDSSLHRSVVIAEYGWWQDARDLGLPGFDPAATTGSNYNLLIDDHHSDPISGSVPMRSAQCDVEPEPTDVWTGTAPFIVTDMRAEGKEVLSLELTPSGPRSLPNFLPGQHITLTHFPDGQTPLTRSYSLTSPAEEARRGTYNVAIRHVTGGAFSGFVHQQVSMGATIHVTPPSGLFVIPPKLDQPVVMIAAGIGITPFVSYLETVARASGSGPEMVLHYGSRNSQSHAFAQKISDLAAKIPTLTVVNHYSRPLPNDVEGRDHSFLGLVSVEHIEPQLIRRRARFYLCGPEDMLQKVSQGLTAKGVPKFDIFMEKFHSAAVEVAIPDDARALINFARSGKTLPWSRKDGNILQFAEKEGIRLPSGCRLGQCESCVVSVLSGRVAHFDNANDDLRSDQCLTCQAVPASDLTLDA